MPSSGRELGQDLARGTLGAVNLGMPLLYTMETWWLAWRLPAWLLVSFASVGIVAIVVAEDRIGFRRGEDHRHLSWAELARNAIMLVVVSLAAAYLILLLFGIIDWSDSLTNIVRHGLIQVVPLGLGAAIANIVFRTVDEEHERHVPTFTAEMASFALGAAFFSFAVAPTEEMELMAAHAGWWRLLVIAVASLVFTYLVLYVLEFRGRGGRRAGMDSPWLRWGETVAGYALALLISAGLLFSYGHFLDATFAEIVQKTVVLALLASLGGAAARVVV